MKIERWNSEACLDVKTDLIQIDGGFDLDIYRKAPDSKFELGAEQLDIILNRKPRSSYVAFPFEAPNLDLFLQPPLTAQEITMGAFRPDDIVNSVAVYDKYRRGNEYKAGKVAHIFRPLLIDDLGKKAWADWFLKPNLLGITLPQKFLDTAKYPVIVDPTFGKTDKGVSHHHEANYIWGSKYTCPEACTVQSLTVYLKDWDASDKSKCAIYKASDLSFVDNTEEWTVPDAFDDWHTFNFSSDPSLTNQDYWLCNWNNANTFIYYDAGATNQVEYDSQAYNGFPNPLSPTNYLDEILSIYATYTAAGGKVPVFMDHYRRLRI